MLDKTESSIKDFVAKSVLNINSKFAAKLYEALKERADQVGKLDNISKYQFVLQDNYKLQRVISSIFASLVTEGMIMYNGKDMETKIHKFNSESIIENLIFYDLYQHKYELLPVIVDVLGEVFLKEITLNYTKYLEKLVEIESKTLEFKSLLRSRALFTTI